MIRKLTRSYSLRVVAPFFAILIALTAQTLTPPLFFPGMTYGSGGVLPYSVAVADVNGDGKPDLVVANGSSNSIGVLLGSGDGTFQPVATYGSGGVFPQSVAIADVNGDGKPDLLVANYCLATGSSNCGATANGVVSVLLGNGDGTFQPAVSYDAGGRNADSVVVTDVNGDGKPDLVVGTFFYYVGVLLGNGDGTFQPVVTYLGQTNIASVAVGDFNGDGKPDLVATTSGSGGVFVLLNNGDGTFPHVVEHYTGGDATSVAVADVNRDGKLDLVVANYGGGKNYDGSVGVLLGNGDGTFQLLTVLDSGGHSPFSVVVTDVNHDGVPDILVANCSSGLDLCNSNTKGSITVFLGGVDGTFQPARKYPSSPLPFGLAAADVNGDAWPDLAVASYGGVELLLNAAGRSPTTLTMSTSGSPSFVGQPVTFTATGTSKYGTIPNGESVTFYDGTTAIGTGTTAGGMASFTTSSLTGTTHHIKGTYAGDATFEPSSGLVNQVVDKYSTTTTLNSSVNPSNYGQAVTLTAKVTSAGPAPTGTVTFKNGSVSLGYGTLNASGVATWNTAKIPVGANTLTSTYNGDAFNAKSVLAGITQTVRQASIHLVLTSTPNPSTLGKSVHFTATLTSNGSLPTGQPVTFSYNGAILGTVNVNSTGVAIFSTTSLPRGSDVITAAYAGSVDYSSASATVTQVVN
jgi:hypothetical protein